jgi:hypothetical protein
MSSGSRRRGYDLVERMEYLYVRVVKARGLKWSGNFDPFAEIKLGSYSCATRHIEKTASPEWNDVFAFSRERIPAPFLEVVVRGKGFAKEDYAGRARSTWPTRRCACRPTARSRRSGTTSTTRKGSVGAR